MPFGWSVANKLVFKKVRQALGFDRCRMCLTAAAPIMKDTLDFFMSLNIPLLEIYGMSETSGKYLRHCILQMAVFILSKPILIKQMKAKGFYFIADLQYVWY